MLRAPVRDAMTDVTTRRSHEAEAEAELALRETLKWGYHGSVEAYVSTSLNIPDRHEVRHWQGTDRNQKHSRQVGMQQTG